MLFFFFVFLSIFLFFFVVLFFFFFFLVLLLVPELGNRLCRPLLSRAGVHRALFQGLVFPAISALGFVDDGSQPGLASRSLGAFPVFRVRPDGGDGAVMLIGGCGSAKRLWPEELLDKRVEARNAGADEHTVAFDAVVKASVRLNSLTCGRPGNTGSDTGLGTAWAYFVHSITFGMVYVKSLSIVRRIASV